MVTEEKRRTARVNEEGAHADSVGSVYHLSLALDSHPKTTRASQILLTHGPYSVFLILSFFLSFSLFNTFSPSSPLQISLFSLPILFPREQGSPQLEDYKQRLRHDRLLSVPEPPPIRLLLLLAFLIRRGRNDGRSRDVVPVIVRGARIW